VGSSAYVCPKGQSILIEHMFDCGSTRPSVFSPQPIQEMSTGLVFAVPRSNKAAPKGGFVADYWLLSTEY